MGVSTNRVLHSAGDGGKHSSVGWANGLSHRVVLLLMMFMRFLSLQGFLAR